LQQREAASRRQRQRPNWTRIAGWTLVPALLVLLWELGGRLSMAEGTGFTLFPPASQVLRELAAPLREHYAMGSLAGNTLVSLVRVACGFSLAALVGVSLGLVLGSSRMLRDLIEPLVEVVRPLCPIAWLPFAIAVFGITRLHEVLGAPRFTGTVLDEIQIGMIFILFWGAFFPILLNTLDGVAGIRRSYLRLAWTLGAGPVRTFLQVRLPAAMPQILTGLRQGIGTCWFVIIAAEMMPGSDSGLGNLLFEAGDQLDMPLLLACMLIIGGFGALLNFSLVKGLGRFVRWHGKEA
jgi:sulfonate transport system permease protein